MIDSQFFTNYFAIIEQKYLLHKETNPQRNDPKVYLQWLWDEIWEVLSEIKNNNHVYLEDELWDILRDYLNVIFLLQQEWKIDSVDSVFNRSLKKYTQRIDIIKNMKDHTSEERDQAREFVKSQQKIANKNEQNIRPN